MRYALLDWDNTLRKNYTLFCWIDYLAGHQIISSDKYKKINDILKKYENKTITHEQLAKMACEEYARAIQGIEEEYLFAVAKEFNELDKVNMYSFVPKLFDLLHRNCIKPIIVSGAPMVIISQYFNEYGIEEAYGFDCVVSNKKYVGSVKNNYGFNKLEVVKKIERKEGKIPYLAIGDSESDFPMLDCAHYGFLMNQGIERKKYIIINETTALQEIDKIFNKRDIL